MSILSALSVSRAPSLAFVVVGLFWGCFAASVPVIKAQIGASDALFGTLLLGTSFGLVTAMWLAPRVDRALRDRGMQVAAAMLALVWLLPGQLHAAWAFAAAMMLVGVMSGLLDVVMNARVSELEATHGRSLMNANHGMFSVAYAIAAIVTGLAREAGLPLIFVFGGFCVVVALMLPAMRMTIGTSEPHDRAREGYPFWPIVICGSVVLVAFMSEATVEAWSALHIERTLNGGATEGALGPAMLGLTMAIGRFSGQAVSGRLSEVQVVSWAALISAGGALIVAVAPVPAVAYLGFGIMGLGVSVIGPMGLALVGRMVPAALRTEAISRAAVMGFSGFFFAPILMGLISQAFGLRIAFGTVAGLLLLALPLAAILRRMQAR